MKRSPVSLERNILRSSAVYLDHAATTPLDPRVSSAMERSARAVFGNPGSLHVFGQAASRTVFAARRSIADAIGCRYPEVVFTGSATEANNLALRGALKGFREWGIGYRKNENPKSGGSKTLYPKPYTLNPRSTLHPRIIVSAIEHASVLETARDLERDDVDVAILPVSRDGIVQVGELPRLLNDRTVLVSVMYANNEVGTIQPIAEIAKIIQGFRVSPACRSGRGLASKGPKPLNPTGYTPYPLFHTDAVQAFQYLDSDVRRLGVDLMTLSAHKIYGPKGIGALYVRGFGVQGIGDRQADGSRGAKTKTLYPQPYTLNPIITGGGQEEGLRSGTEHVANIVGFAKAVERTVALREREAKRVRALVAYALRALKRRAPALRLNGSRGRRLPNNLYLYVPGMPSAELAIRLDRLGFAVSAGPACAARSAEPSPVLQAMGCSEARCRESIRITLGRATTRGMIDRFLDAIIQLYIQHI